MILRTLIVLNLVVLLAACAGGTGTLSRGEHRGPRLVFTSLQKDKRFLYVVNTDGSGLRKVAGGWGSKAIWPAWSPDGRALAYLTDRKGNWEIYITTEKERSPKRMTRTPERESAPAWSPVILGDSWIAYIVKEKGEDRGDQIFAMRPDGSGRNQLTVSSGKKIAPAWSPDGKQIAFESNAAGSWDIYTMTIDGAAPERIYSSGSSNETPVWSPDGSQIAFETEHNGNWDIYVMNSDGSMPSRLTHSPGVDSNPAWSPDGEWLAFDTVEGGNGEIYSIRLDGTGLRNLSRHPADDIGPQWSPDGSEIAFSSDRGGQYQIHVVDPGTGELRQVTKLEGENKWPFWSPEETGGLK